MLSSQATTVSALFGAYAYIINILVQVRHRTEYYAPQVKSKWDSNSWPPYHDSTFHVTETPVLTTRPSVTSPKIHILFCHMHQKNTLVWTNTVNMKYRDHCSVLKGTVHNWFMSLVPDQGYINDISGAVFLHLIETICDLKRLVHIQTAVIICLCAAAQICTDRGQERDKISVLCLHVNLEITVVSQ